MADFKGVECPICKSKFAENDDIVVCPSCGAPYHRDCYKAEGRCIFEDKHKNNESWKCENKSEYKICENCNKENPKEAKMCEECGFPFNLNINFDFSEKTNNKAKTNPHEKSNTNFPQGNIFSFMIDKFGGVDKDEKFDDITTEELADYVGNSTRYYIPEFKRIKDINRSRFNFSAFIFSSYWFFYRKQYKWGILAAMLLTLFSLYDIICNLAYIINPSYQVTKTGIIISYVCYFLYIISKIIISIFANKLYYRHCLKKIKKIKLSSSTVDEYKTNLKTKGNVSLIAASAVALLSVLLTYLAMYFLS